MHYIYEDRDGLRTIAPCTISTMAEVEGKYLGQRLVAFDPTPANKVEVMRVGRELRQRTRDMDEGRGLLALYAVLAMSVVTTMLALLSLSMC